MNRRIAQQPLLSPSLYNAMILAAIIATALIFGLLIGVGGAVQAITVFGVVLVLIAGALWPLQGVMIAIAFLFEAIPVNELVSFGTFKPHEILLGYLVVVVLIRTLFAGRSIVAPMAEFKWPMFYLLFCVLTSFVYAQYIKTNPYIMGEARGFLGWLTLPLILASVRDDKDRRFLIHCMLAIGLVMAVIVTAQSIFNVKILSQARVEVLDAESNSDVTRSIAGGGTYIIIFSLYYMILMPMYQRWPTVLRILAGMILLSGLAVMFGRGIWMATSVGLILATFIARGLRGVAAMSIFAVLGLVAFLAVMSLFNARLVEAVVDRGAGVGEEFQSGASFGWRGLENKAALAVIKERPLTGVGLGGEYKKTISNLGHFEFETIYIHNAYMGFAVKMGVHAALFPPFMLLTFFIVTRRTLKRAGNDKRLLVSCLAGAFVVPAITSYTQPEWLSDQGVGAFCLLASVLVLTGAKLKGSFDNLNDEPEPASTALPGSLRPNPIRHVT